MINQAAIACGPLGPVEVVRAEGVEAMNTLPTWTLDVLSADGALDLEGVVDSPAVLGLGDDAGGTRSIPLLVTDLAYGGPHRDGQHRYHLELAAPVWSLTQRAGYRIFQEKTTQEIIAALLTDAGVPAAQVSWRLSGRYARRVHCAQYDETEWGFAARLLAEEGINFWFDQTDDDAPLLVFGDSSHAHASIVGGPNLRFQDAGGMHLSAGSIFDLERTYELCPGKVHVRDFDPRRPSSPIEGTAGDGPFEHYEFPALVPNDEAAAARARARLEQLRRLEVRASAGSSCARVQPGRVIRVEGAADEIHDGEHLVVEVRHLVVQSTRNEAGANQPYTNRLLLVPVADDRAFRPAPPGARPRVDGIETAVTTGPAGEEIHVDDLGSVKLRFHWDRSGVGDDKSSRWVRCLQMSMYGSMLLPRVGWEVPVAYLDGNPDLPFVLGRLYNGGAPVPYGLPGKKATTTLQSATSPGGGSTHELRFADDAGGMEAFIHATKDQSVFVGGDNTVHVSVNETHDVAKSSVLTVHGAQTTTIAAKQSVVVGADGDVNVKGGRTEAIGGMESIKVTGTYHLECKGLYSEVVGGIYGLECNQSNTTVQGSFTQTVAGAMLTTGGLGSSNAVAAARLEDVGGARSFTSLASYADTVKGAKNLSISGAGSDTAGTDVVTSVGGVALIKVGAGADLKAGGPIAFEAPKITVTVGGTLTAKGGGTLKIGGKVETSGGKTKFAADKTKKKSTSKVG